MSAAAKELLEAALKLSEEDREFLATALYATLSGGFESEEIEAAWMKEIQRRSDEIDAGQAELVDWTEIRARIAERRMRRAG